MVVGLLILVLLAVAAAAVLVPRRLDGRLSALRDETSRQLSERNADVDRRLADVTETLDRRLESSGQTASKIHERLGQVNAVMAEVNDRAKELGRLEQALRPPKARGGVGELLLENLLRDQLPRDAFDLQYTFPSGERVDAVVRAGGLLLPIDAKFPLDNFERMASAGDDAEKQLHEKAFARDVKGHIDAIASKYIRPEHGTFDLAFMYLPVETIHYELVSGKTGALLNYAHGKRVFPVSAGTFSAYLQMIVLGLRGMQIEKHAEEVMKYCAALQKDFAVFREDFDLVGKHLSNAQGKFASAEKRLDRFETKLEQASDEQADLPAATVHALDAA